MRLLIVSAGLKPDHFGGLPAHVEDLVRSLAARGESVGYLNTGAKSAWPGTRLSRRTDLPCPAWNLVSRWAHTRYWTGTLEPQAQVRPDAAYARAFLRVIAEFRPDVVHFHELTSFPLALAEELRARGIRLVYTPQDYYSLCPTVKLQRPDGTECRRAAGELDCDGCSLNAQFNRALQWEHATDRWFGGVIKLRNLARRVVRATARRRGKPAARPAYQERRREFDRLLAQFDAVMVTSTDQRRRLSEWPGHAWKLRDLPLSRRTFRTAPPPARTQEVQPGKLVFVALNIVNPAKGLSVLQEAFAALAAENVPAELHLYGLAAGTSPGVRSFGPYDDTTLDDILNRADFGLLPSLWPEAYGYVGPEMLSRGLPVLASRIGAMPDYVRDGMNGLLFNPHERGDLAKAVKRLVDSPELRRTLWRGVSEGPRHYLTFDQHLDRLLAVYRELLAAPAPATAPP